MFLWTKDEITDEQNDAILFVGDVFLIACPGSGKTRTLTYKIAYELDKQKSAKRYVIAITYTNAAADEIKERIERLGVDTSQLWIGTIHAFCTEWILRPYGFYLDDLKFGFRVLNNHESDDLLDELCKKLYPDDKITSFHCKYMLKPDHYVLMNDSKHRDKVGVILKKHWEYLSKNGLIDFELILYYSYLLIDKVKPTIANILAGLFQYILLDEFQDTKSLQYELLSRIICESKPDVGVFIVGDPNQAIYTTMGGYPILQADFERTTKRKFEPFALTANYRSSQKIIEYFGEFCTVPTQIIASGKNKDYPSTITFNDIIQVEDLVSEVARLIKYNIEQLKMSPNEICVVAPQWTHLTALARNLMVKLPEYSFNGPGMSPLARDVDNFFFHVCRLVLTEPGPSIYLSRLRWAREILKELDHAGVNVDDFPPKRLLRIINSFQIDEPEGLPYLKAAFDQLARTLNFDIGEHPKFDKDYIAFFESAEKRIASIVKAGNAAIVSVESFKKVFKQKEGISISSMHGVKGLEFDTVIAFGFLEGYVPHKGDASGSANAKKMLYVVASRARLNLHIIAEERDEPYSRPTKPMPITQQLAAYLYDYDLC
jgi:DNA helicase-2/ATP-dependent DNA helicase PcrA